MAEQNNLFHAVERVYAMALLELAEAANSVETTADEMKQIRKLLADQPDVTNLLASRVLSKEQRDGALVAAFKGRVSDLVFRFLRVLVSKDRFDELPGIAGAFAHLVDERHGTIEIQATAASALDPTSVESIKSRIAGLTGRKVRIHETLDAEMIGGIKLRVADELIDGSVVTQLRKMRENLIDSGRQNAKTHVASIVKD